MLCAGYLYDTETGTSENECREEGGVEMKSEDTHDEEEEKNAAEYESCSFFAEEYGKSQDMIRAITRDVFKIFDRKRECVCEEQENQNRGRE